MWTSAFVAVSSFLAEGQNVSVFVSFPLPEGGCLHFSPSSSEKVGVFISHRPSSERWVSSFLTVLSEKVGVFISLGHWVRVIVDRHFWMLYY